MTVAIGFCFSDSVLVGADSQMTAGDSKLDGNKTGDFTASWGQVIVSFAGNAKYAAAAFQRCQRAKESPPVLADPVEGLMRILKDHYHAHVFSRPEYDKHPEYDYSLFLGIKTNNNNPQLFEVEYGDHREITSFQCAGTGGEYARVVLRWLHSQQMSIDRAVALASYVIGHVKVRAQYCGGATRLKVLTGSGIIDTSEVEKRTTVLIQHIENVGNWFACECEQFLLRHAFGGPEDFAHLVDLLNVRAVRVRHMWDLRLKALEDPEFPIPVLSDPPPWPE